jgi:predicted transcriptional regulator
VPTVQPEIAGQSAISRLLDTMFGGAPERLLAQLVSDRRVDRAKLEQLRKMLDDKLGSRGKTER